MTDTNSTSDNSNKQLYADTLLTLLNNMNDANKILTRITTLLMVIIIVKTQLNAQSIKPLEFTVKSFIELTSITKSFDNLLPYIIIAILSISSQILKRIPTMIKLHIGIALANDNQFSKIITNATNRYGFYIKLLIIVNLTVILSTLCYLAFDLTINMIIGCTFAIFVAIVIIFVTTYCGGYDDEFNLIKHLTKKINEH